MAHPSRVALPNNQVRARSPKGEAPQVRGEAEPSGGVRESYTAWRHYGRVARPPSRLTVAQPAEALRRLLAAIDEGEIDADDPKARALHRRLEGAAAAWEEVAYDDDAE